MNKQQYAAFVETSSGKAWLLRNRASITKHGHTKSTGEQTPTYSSYASMKRRVLGNGSKKDYAGEGITIDPRWLGEDGYINFLEDMGERPAGTTIDRIDNGGNYTPGNCRWATPTQQNFNQKLNSRNTSGHRGIQLTNNGRFVANIQVNHKRVFTKRFDTIEEAIKARTELEVQYGITSR